MRLTCLERRTFEAARLFDFRFLRFGDMGLDGQTPHVRIYRLPLFQLVRARVRACVRVCVCACV